MITTTDKERAEQLANMYLHQLLAGVALVLIDEDSERGRYLHQLLASYYHDNHEYIAHRGGGLH